MWTCFFVLWLYTYEWDLWVMVTMFKSFEGLQNYFPKWLYHYILYSHRHCARVPVSPQPANVCSFPSF